MTSWLPRIVSFEQLFEFVSLIELDVGFTILTMLCSRKHEIVKWVLHYESMTYCTWEMLYPFGQTLQNCCSFKTIVLIWEAIVITRHRFSSHRGRLGAFLRGPAALHIDSAAMEVDLGLVLRTCSAAVAWILLPLEAELWYFNFKFWCKISLCDWVNWGVGQCLLSSWGWDAFWWGVSTEPLWTDWLRAYQKFNTRRCVLPRLQDTAAKKVKDEE